jgi:predicted HicB family RNase H-like nuclease
MIEYKGYLGAIEFDPDLRVFTGYVVDLRDEIYFEGDSVEALEASMRRAVDHYLTVCEQRQEDPERPFSGKLNLRLGPDLHRAAALAAAAEGQSLNQWLSSVVAAAANSEGDAPRRNATAKVRSNPTSTRSRRSRAN